MELETGSEQHSPTPTGFSLNHNFPVTIVRIFNKNALTCLFLPGTPQVVLTGLSNLETLKYFYTHMSVFCLEQHLKETLREE